MLADSTLLTTRRIACAELVLVFALIACQTALPTRPPSRQTAHVFRYGTRPEDALRYLLYTPVEYAASGRSFPLILFLHGSGERGSDLDLVRREGLPRVLEWRQRFPFVVVAPQRRRGQEWQLGALASLCDEIRRTHRVDERRVFVTGLSTGADAALELAIREPRRFAAVAVVAPLRLPDEVCAIRGIPVRVFHSARDERVPLRRSKKLVRAIEDCGGRATLTVLPQEGHDAWTTVYQTADLYDWLLAAGRTEPPESPPPRPP